MDPALDILSKALVGDPGALSFLERTTSFYVLDATDSSNPKTYGGWNLIHQALNEVERQESNPLSTVKLSPHVQLLATISERVARRSPAADRHLVALCIENASSQYQGTQTDAQNLLNLNAEIREIVMGRIAALAFDFSFHNRIGVPNSSAFADPVAIEKLCGVLAANAVSSGPEPVRYFLMRWIVPSIETLPLFSVACVTLHISIESLRKSAPAGTKDMLQQLSHSVVGVAITPVLAASIAEDNDSAHGLTDHAWKNRVAATTLKALERWCKVTDLSLPQVRHICTKMQINFIGVLSDALYSDSALVIDSMAELLELTLSRRGEVTGDRMKQARYIMEVDEASFRQILPQDLHRIELKEIDAIVSELVSAVGLQRFRFVERQNQGDDEVCRNLTRIAVAVGQAVLSGLMSGQIQGGASGLMDLLMKAASHPAVNICAMSLEVLAQLVPVETDFSVRLLPILQHRAIVPHTLNDSKPSIAPSDICGVDFHEFSNFRETILGDALVACYRQNPLFYMDSCTSAIEEFCSADATVAVSFQLEAALFCLNAISLVVTSASTPEERHDDHLGRCSAALARKPIFITANPLTLAQLNRFLGKFGAWFAANHITGVLDVAAELSLSTFSIAETAFSKEEPARLILDEMLVSPFSEAATTLRILLSKQPSHFISPQALAALGGGWEAAYRASNIPDKLSLEDRISFCIGMCHIFAAIPIDQRTGPYQAFSLPTLQCLRTMLTAASSNGTSVNHLSPYIARIANEIKILSTMIAALKSALPSTPITDANSDASIVILKEAWESISIAAERYSNDKRITESLSELLIACIPRNLESGIQLWKEICTLSSKMVAGANKNEYAFLAVYEVVNEMMRTHGEALNVVVRTVVENQGTPAQSALEETGRCTENIFLLAIDANKETLGDSWTRPKEQGQGQPAFESGKIRREQPIPSQGATTTVALAGILGALETTARVCPAFLTHLPAAPGKDQEVDRLFNRAVESAIKSMSQSDVTLSRNALLFLKSVVDIEELDCAGPVVKQIVKDTLNTTTLTTMVEIIVAGTCGGFHSSSIDPAATLLWTIVRRSSSTLDTVVPGALNQECFQLGDNPKRIILEFLAICSSGSLTSGDLMELLEDVWTLHQAEELESLAGSDLALAFVNKHDQEL